MNRIGLLLIAVIIVGILWFEGNIQIPVADKMLGKILPTTLPQNLVEISGSVVLMEKDAAESFKKMVEEAKKSDVILIPHSGYRSISTQRALWNRFLKLYGSKYTARVLKPPGESEHQTGYALDIDDGNNMQCSLQRCFEDGSAYKWLTENASRFNYELSYPEGNPEGIAFEPWHWRFTGTSEAIRILKY